jgi:hypothetical protein
MAIEMNVYWFDIIATGGYNATIYVKFKDKVDYEQEIPGSTSRDC